MELTIKKEAGTKDGASYTLVVDGIPITTHYCSGDFYAHQDLFTHEETKRVIGSMPLSEFRNIQIYKGA